MSTSKAAFRISLGFVDVYISFLVLLQFSSIFFTYLNFDTSALNEKFIIHFQFKAFLLLFISFRFCLPKFTLSFVNCFISFRVPLFQFSSLFGGTLPATFSVFLFVITFLGWLESNVAYTYILYDFICLLSFCILYFNTVMQRFSLNTWSRPGSFHPSFERHGQYLFTSFELIYFIVNFSLRRCLPVHSPFMAFCFF